MNENALLFIQKAIEKTKNHSLKWCYICNDVYPKTILNKDSENTLIRISEYYSSLSFYSQYNNVYIFLLCYNKGFTLSEYTLAIQTENSPYAKQLASSDDSLDINTQLKRLYNIVEDYVSNITTFIDDFLDS